MGEYPKMYLYKRIVQAKLFIDNNFSSVLRIDDIADEAFFSRFHFIRLFKEIYGKTPHQYLISVRILKAQQLLEQGLSVRETCFSVGFESVSTFTGLFKRYTKSNPLLFQQSYFKRQMAIQDKPLSFIPGCFAGQNYSF